MTTMTLDTSGAIRLVPAISDPDGPIYRWSDLSPFAQGYVEALLRDIQWPDPAEGYGPSSAVVHFDWLAPEALALILKDCERGRQIGWPNTAERGAVYWRESVSRRRTVTLGDDGKVHLREAN